SSDVCSSDLSGTCSSPRLPAPDRHCWKEDSDGVCNDEECRALQSAGASGGGAMTQANMVVAENVHKHFGSLEVLKGIDLEVKVGQVQCLIGASGSGKSTFLRCINHLEEISRGHIWVEDELIGYRIHRNRLHKLQDRAATFQRRDIGMVFQRFNLFPHMTVVGNIIMAPMVTKGI